MLILSFFVATAAALDWVPPPLTADGQNTFLVDGWTPKPTPFLEMAKRLDLPPQDTICGYADGDPAEPFDCSGYPCGYNTLYDWFGCCATASYSGTALYAFGCPIVTGCVPYAELEECNAACASNTMITKCTDTASGYCGYADLVDIRGMTAVVCAPSPFTLEVDLTPTGGGSGATTTIGGQSAQASTTQTIQKQTPTIQTSPTTTVSVQTLNLLTSTTQTSQKAGSTNTPSIVSLGGQVTTSSTSSPAATHNSANVPVSAIRASFVGEIFTALMVLFNLV